MIVSALNAENVVTSQLTQNVQKGVKKMKRKANDMKRNRLMGELWKKRVLKLWVKKKKNEFEKAKKFADDKDDLVPSLPMIRNWYRTRKK